MNNDLIRLLIYLMLGLVPVLSVLGVNWVIAPNECWAVYLRGWTFWIPMTIWAFISLWIAINWRKACLE